MESLLRRDTHPRYVRLRLTRGRLPLAGEEQKLRLTKDQRHVPEGLETASPDLIPESFENLIQGVGARHARLTPVRGSAPAYRALAPEPSKLS